MRGPPLPAYQKNSTESESANFKLCAHSLVTGDADLPRRAQEVIVVYAFKALACANMAVCGWDAAAAKTYGINGVPTLLLIDPAGRIVRRGHIGAVEAENQLDQLGNVTGKP